MRIYKTWTNLKEVFLPKNLLLQYDEQEYNYTIFATEEGVEYFTELWKDTSKVAGIDVTQNNIDLQDFEDNYKENANQSPYSTGQTINVNLTGGEVTAEVDKTKIWDGTNTVTVTSDDSKKRLDVSAKIAGYEDIITWASLNAIKGKLWSAGVEQTIVTVSETNFALFKNPVTSGKKAKIYKIIFGATSAGVSTVARFYVQPTITTNGTLLTPRNRYIGYPGSSAMEVYSYPVTSDNGIFATYLQTSGDSNALIDTIDGSIIIPPGVNVLMTVENSAANKRIAVVLVWVEEE